MKSFLKNIFTVLLIWLMLPLSAFSASKNLAVKLRNKKFDININQTGVINQFISIKNGIKDTISFRNDEISGPAFESVNLTQLKAGKPIYTSIVNGIKYQLEYQLKGEALMLIATISNNSTNIFTPQSVPLRIGINNYQDSFPRWRNILFPTLLRAEKTHFWGYFMSPNGKILTITSPNSIAGWTIGYVRFEKFPHYVGSHRIKTSYLNLLHAHSLSERLPENRRHLAVGEQLIDTIYLTPLESLTKLNTIVSSQAKAPYISFDRYTVFPGETTTAIVTSPSPITKVTINQEGTDSLSELTFKKLSAQTYKIQWVAPNIQNRFNIQVYNQQNKQSEAVLNVRANWSDYLRKARTAALKYLPTTTPNTEAFYPLYTYFLARKLVPDSLEDALAEKVFKTIFPVLFDWKTKEVALGKNRMQNSSNLAAMLADRYVATNDTNAMNDANGLIEFLMRNQGADGGYYAYWNPTKKEHYSCVNYLTKTFMEVLTQEYKLAQKSELWKKRYNTGVLSVNRALEDLVQRKDNLGTEGQMTFDDTTISCSIGQLAMGALRTPDPILRQKYLSVALEMYNQHRCLTQQSIPDARMNGATLRFWESQFTINLMNNMMNSPCGWSAWKIYGTYYLYLLTGEKKYLYETMNALGTCSQLINLKNNTLYFAFVPDPYIEGQQYRQAVEGSRMVTIQNVVVGEQYLPCISNWHSAPYYAWRKDVFGIDNFVHEVFKAMEEITIQHAFVIENADGSFETFNCKMETNGGKLVITPYEKLVKSVHVNLIKSHNIDVIKQGETVQFKDIFGMQWLGEVPEDIRTYEIIKTNE